MIIRKFFVLSTELSDQKMDGVMIDHIWSAIETADPTKDKIAASLPIMDRRG